MKTLRPALTITAFLLLVCCLLYPAIVTAAAQAMWPGKANGSLVVRNGKTLGSEIIGQSVADWAAHPEYLWGRASAASNDATSGITISSGSNYGPNNPALADEVKARVDLLRASGVVGSIPIDLVTKSASGLDPELSPAAADVQAPRLAIARQMSVESIRAILAAHTSGSTFGVFGEPRVNVLAVNLDLDDKAPLPAKR
ncbi:MAG: potassium-transporting ATPase subunit KdpC [Polyangiales bacterium]